MYVQVNDRTYFEIADGSEGIAQISILLIIVGVFIVIVGVVGAVGAIFTNTIFGRITLRLVSCITVGGESYGTRYLGGMMLKAQLQ